MENKSYNMAALMGGKVDDIEYVEELGLDPTVAYTPYINDLILDKVHADNLNTYMDAGASESEARSKADTNRAQSKRYIKERLASKGML